jgi:hypothetical protein
MFDNDEPPDWAFCSLCVALIQLALDLTQWISPV